MSLEAEIRTLQKVELFHAFNREQLRALAFSSEKRTIEDHAVIYQEGAPAEGGLVVLEGTVGKVLPSPSGPRIVERQQPGALIDEHALIADSKRSGTAIAIGTTTLLVVRREMFRRILQEYPELAAPIHSRWSQHLLATTHELAAVGNRLEKLDSQIARLSNGEGKTTGTGRTDENGD